MDFRVQRRVRRNRQEKNPRIRWWLMKHEKQKDFQRRIEEKAKWDKDGSAQEMWGEMVEVIRKVAKEIFGETKGIGARDKESWWWDTSVQQKVKAKREHFKKWSLCRNAENWEKYKTAKKETKVAVSEARMRAYTGLYQSLGTKEGERGIYKIAKARERKTRDLDQIKCIKDNGGNVLVTDESIINRWKNYFHKLSNEGHETLSNPDRVDMGSEDQNYSYYRRIRECEVKEALKQMKTGRAVGPDNIPVEVWKDLGEKGVC